jgi:hypothetical protein
MRNLFFYLDTIQQMVRPTTSVSESSSKDDTAHSAQTEVTSLYNGMHHSGSVAGTGKLPFGTLGLKISRDHAFR